MDRYAAGDDSAFDALYALLAPRLYGFLARQTDEIAAEDLLQQTFMRIHKARGTFKPAGEVVPWAFAIARALFIDGCRRAKVRPIADGEAEPDMLKSGDASLEEELDARKLAERFDAALRKIPETQRIAWELVRCDGCSIREAAEILGTTIAAVKLRVHRAYEALRVVLGDAAGPEPEGEES